MTVCTACINWTLKTLPTSHFLYAHLSANGTIHTWRAPMAALWNRRSVLKSCAISLTRRWNGSFLMSSSVDFWYRRISLRATVPGLYLCGFFTPPVDGALFRAALVANCLRGALPPVDLRAVCFVRAIVELIYLYQKNQKWFFIEMTGLTWCQSKWLHRYC